MEDLLSLIQSKIDVDSFPLVVVDPMITGPAYELVSALSTSCPQIFVVELGEDPFQIYPSVQSGKLILLIGQALQQVEKDIKVLLSSGLFFDVVLFSALSETSHNFVYDREDLTKNTYSLFEQNFKADICKSIVNNDNVELIDSTENNNNEDDWNNGGWGDDWGKEGWDSEPSAKKKSTSRNVSVKIITAPILNFEELLPNSLFFAAYSKIFPVIPSDLRFINEMLIQSHCQPISNIKEMNIHMLSGSTQSSLRTFSASLVESLLAYNLKPALFTVGVSSEILGKEINFIQKKRGDQDKYNSSLIIVDRTVDLAACVGHHSASMLDQVFHCLPNRNHQTDVHVDLSRLCDDDPSSSVVSKPNQGFGRIFHGLDSTATSVSTALCEMEKRDSLVFVRKNILECMTKEKLNIPMGSLGRVNSKHLHSLVSIFSNSSFSLARKYSDLLECTIAVAQTLDMIDNRKWEEKFAAEKEILLNTMDPGAIDLFELLTEYIPVLDTEDVLCLCLFSVSLLGSDCYLNKESGDAFLSKLAASCPDLQNQEKEMGNTLLGAIRRICSLTTIRQSYKSVISLHQKGEVGRTKTQYEPFLVQMFDTLFDREMPELPYLKHIGGTTKGLAQGLSSFTSGFGGFGGLTAGIGNLLESKARPTDHKTIVLCVVGGITFDEIYHIRKITAAFPEFKIIIASNEIATQKNTLKNIVKPTIL